MAFEVQTRDDDGELRYFATFQEALDYSRKNLEVWKISFELASGERVRLVRREGQFVLEQMMDAVMQVLKERNVSTSES